MGEYGVFDDRHDTARVISRCVSEFFGKKHAHVLQNIQNLDCSDEFRKSNFGLLPAIPDFNQRKRQLRWYLAKTSNAENYRKEAANAGC